MNTCYSSNSKQPLQRCRLHANRPHPSPTRRINPLTTPRHVTRLSWWRCGCLIVPRNSHFMLLVYEYLLRRLFFTASPTFSVFLRDRPTFTTSVVVLFLLFAFVVAILPMTFALVVAKKYWFYNSFIFTI